MPVDDADGVDALREGVNPVLRASGCTSGSPWDRFRSEPRIFDALCEGLCPVGGGEARDHAVASFPGFFTGGQPHDIESRVCCGNTHVRGECGAAFFFCVGFKFFRRGKIISLSGEKCKDFRRVRR